jgi:hypothetical protein
MLHLLPATNGRYLSSSHTHWLAASMSRSEVATTPSLITVTAGIKLHRNTATFSHPLIVSPLTHYDAIIGTDVFSAQRSTIDSKNRRACLPDVTTICLLEKESVLLSVMSSISDFFPSDDHDDIISELLANVDPDYATTTAQGVRTNSDLPQMLISDINSLVEKFISIFPPASRYSSSKFPLFDLSTEETR